MRKLWIILGGLALFFVIGIAIAGFVAIGQYNGFVKSSQAVDAQWAQVENVYQRRADLVPNLVATVSGAANFEKSTLTEITEARASVGSIKLPENSAPTDPSQLAAFEQAQNRLGSALSRLLVVSERYPDLKATTNFQMLQTQLEGAENRISVERGRFNEVAREYNTKIQTFPGMFIARLAGFTPKPYFSAKPGADTPPAVNFDFGKQTTQPEQS